MDGRILCQIHEGRVNKKVKFCAILSSAVYIPSLFHVCWSIIRVLLSQTLKMSLSPVVVIKRK